MLDHPSRIFPRREEANIKQSKATYNSNMTYDMDWNMVMKNRSLMVPFGAGRVMGNGGLESFFKEYPGYLEHPCG